MNQQPTTLIGDVPETWVLMPSQWADAFRSTPDAPERLLWFGVLQDAIRCSQGILIADGSDGFRQLNATSHRLRRQREAQAWIDSDETYPGSFTWICDNLDIGVDYLRKALSAGIKLQRRSPVTDNRRVSADRPRVRRAEALSSIEASVDETSPRGRQRPQPGSTARTARGASSGFQGP